MCVSISEEKSPFPGTEARREINQGTPPLKKRGSDALTRGVSMKDGDAVYIGGRRLISQ